MKKTNNPSYIKEQIEVAIVPLINSSNDISFRDVDKLIWGLETSNGFYGVQCLNDKISLLKDDEVISYFSVNDISSLEKFVDSLNIEPVNQNNYAFIEKLTQSSKDYDLAVVDDTAILDVNYFNNARLKVKELDSENGKYCLHYDDGAKFVPISLNKESVEFERSTVVSVASFKDIGDVANQISKIDGDVLESNISESKNDKNNKLHGKLMDAINVLYGSADEVNFYMDKDNDIVLNVLDSDGSKYKFDIRENFIVARHDGNNFLNCSIDDLGLLRHAVFEETNTIPDYSLTKLSSHLTNNAYLYSIAKEDKDNEFSSEKLIIRYNNGLNLEGTISSLGLVEGSLSFDKDGIEIPIAVGPRGFYAVKSPEEAAFEFHGVSDLNYKMLTLSNMDSSKIEELIAKTEDFNLNSEKASLEEIRNNLVAATSKLHFSSNEYNVTVDRNNNSVNLNSNFDIYDADSDFRNAFLNFLAKDGKIDVSLNGENIGQWSLDEISDMKRVVIDNVNPSMSYPLVALPNSLLENSNNYNISVNRDMFFREVDNIQSFHVEYNNNLILNGVINADNSVDYHLSVNTGKEVVPVIAINDLFCAAEDVKFAITHTDSVYSLVEDINKFNVADSSAIKEAIEKGNDFEHREIDVERISSFEL